MSGNRQYVYKTTLSKRYGLTPKLIRELDPPDKETINLHWRSGPPAYLYEVGRVEKFIEQNKERVEKERCLREKLSVAGRNAYLQRLEKEVAEAKEWARTVPIEVYKFPADFDQIRAHSGDSGVQAHVRHRYTNYELLLRDLYEFKSDIQDEVYPVLKARFEVAVDTAVQVWELEQHRNRVVRRVDRCDSCALLPLVASAT